MLRMMLLKSFVEKSLWWTAQSSIKQIATKLTVEFGDMLLKAQQEKCLFAPRINTYNIELNYVIHF